MIRLLTAACPKCGNTFHVEADTPDDGADPGGCVCRCPRCQTDFSVPAGEGVPQPGPIGWAVTAEAAGG